MTHENRPNPYFPRKLSNVKTDIPPGALSNRQVSGPYDLSCTVPSFSLIEQLISRIKDLEARVSQLERR